MLKRKLKTVEEITAEMTKDDTQKMEIDGEIVDVSDLIVGDIPECLTKPTTNTESAGWTRVKGYKPRKSQTSYPVMEVKQLLAIFREVENINPIMSLMLEFSARTGLRYSDIAQLSLSDVIDRNCMIKDRFAIYQQKTGTMLHIGVNDELKNVIAQAAYYQTENNHGTRLLFASTSPQMIHKNTAISSQYINRVLKKVGAKLGIPYQISTHSMRKTFAFLILKMEGSSIVDVQRRLGHRSITSTQRYLQSFTDTSEGLMKNISF